MVAILQKLATIWETQTIVENKKETNSELKEQMKVETNLNLKDITIEKYYYNEGALYRTSKNYN